jgi:hypothetical protein
VAALGLGDDPVEQVPKRGPDRVWTWPLPDAPEAFPCAYAAPKPPVPLDTPMGIPMPLG